MSISMSNDIRLQYDKSFATLRSIVEAFPKEKWLVPHSDIYYIPSRIAYHLAVFISKHLNSGFLDPNFNNSLPFGIWIEATAETLPSKEEFLSYYDEIVEKSIASLALLNDEALKDPVESERSWFGESQLGVHTYCIREIAAHTGELNKMLIENGLEDIWVFR